MSKRALFVLSDGYEDMEAVAPMDVLFRAGVQVTIAGLREGVVKAAYGTNLMPHTTIDKVDGLYDAIVLPGGGENAKSLAGHPRVVELVRQHMEAGKLVAAICAAPGSVLARAAGVVKGRKVTGAPMEPYIDWLSEAGGERTDSPVAADGNLITAMGPGAALQFGLALAQYLTGDEIVNDLKQRWRLS